MTNFVLNKLVIIGVGLIGGSFALALRKATAVRHIIGVGRSKKNLQHALDQGVIDEIAENLAGALQDADFILLAMPVGQTERVMMQITPHLQTNSIISDAGSTKTDVITAARTHLGKHLKNFVPGHPIAGAEQSSVAAAQADLFVGKHIILTPIKETRIDAIRKTVALWQACGAHVSQMNVKEHDETLAATSHLPHILAFTLMNHLRHSTDQPESLLRFAGSGFRDFTRIASSSPEMWRDISLSNRIALLKQINTFQNELKTLQTMLEEGNGKALENAFSEAREMREDWLKRKN